MIINLYYINLRHIINNSLIVISIIQTILYSFNYKYKINLAKFVYNKNGINIYAIWI
jgi:hypothetical protein